MEDTAIKIEGLTKAYKLYNKNRDRLKEAIFTKKNCHTDFFAINGIDITIKKGDCVGIIGKNGSGKSTLLKLLTGVLTPSSGNITVNGKIAALLELGAGFNMEYTGIENIYLNGMIMGYSKNEIEQKISEIIEFADISDFINQPVKTYSSGMFVRLAFAVAINVEPDILIVDEALSVGDIFFQLKCYKKFEDFKKQGKTVVLVTHDYGSVIKYCDYAIVLDKGKIAGQGNCREMIDVYKKILANQDKKSIVNKVNSFSISKKDTIKEKMILNPNYTEYGNKDAEIIDYGVIDYKEEIAQTLLKNEEFTIKMVVKFNKNIKSPIFAFAIKDLKGNELSGTNTMLEGIELNEVNSGTILEVSFKQLNVFQNGTLFLSYACTAYNQNGNLEVFHRLFDIISIDTIAEKNSVGFFDLNSKITISEL